MTDNKHIEFCNADRWVLNTGKSNKEIGTIVMELEPMMLTSNPPKQLRRLVVKLYPDTELSITHRIESDGKVSFALDKRNLEWDMELIDLLQDVVDKKRNELGDKND
jgi:hypothetical protein